MKIIEKIKTIPGLWLTVLAIGIALGGFFIGDGIYRAMSGRTVTVKGLAERDVVADTAVWNIKINGVGGDVATLQSKIDADITEIHNFLIDAGFAESDIKNLRVQVRDKYAGYSDAELKKTSAAVQEFRKAFDVVASKLTDARHVAAEKLRQRLLAELPDLKLGSADFVVDFGVTAPSALGTDDVVFMIKTNTGAPFAPLHRAASGGELARLMLAMRVVLAGADDAHTFVFDEIDTGVSGRAAEKIANKV